LNLGWKCGILELNRAICPALPDYERKLAKNTPETSIGRERSVSMLSQLNEVLKRAHEVTLIVVVSAIVVSAVVRVVVDEVRELFR
jgi:hypothetical protein